MEIQGPGGVSGPHRMEPHQVPIQGSESTPDAASVHDQVEISEQARLLEQLSQVPAIRTERVQELQKLIESGEFETAERVAGAVEKLLEEV